MRRRRLTARKSDPLTAARRQDVAAQSKSRSAAISGLSAGGISRGRHVLQYALAGVSGVQIGGALYNADDPARKVNEILEDLASLA